MTPQEMQQSSCTRRYRDVPCRTTCQWSDWQACRLLASQQVMQCTWSSTYSMLSCTNGLHTHGPESIHSSPSLPHLSNAHQQPARLPALLGLPAQTSKHLVLSGVSLMISQHLQLLANLGPEQQPDLARVQADFGNCLVHVVQPMLCSCTTCLAQLHKLACVSARSWVYTMPECKSRVCKYCTACPASACMSPHAVTCQIKLMASQASSTISMELNGLLK